jgi:DNA-binding CsgD family transcriptional regulator
MWGTIGGLAAFVWSPSALCSGAGVPFAPNATVPLAEIPDGTPLTEIAARFGVTVTVARRWITAEGLAPLTRRPGARRPRAFDVARVVALYLERRTQAQIAAELGCGVTTVGAYVREAGVGRRALPRLDDDAIARRYRAGESLAEIAAALGASKSGVSHALDRAGGQAAIVGDSMATRAHRRQNLRPGWSSLVVLR